MQWHIIYFPVPKGRKHWIKARPKPTRANNKLCSSMPMSGTLKGLNESAPLALLNARHSSLGLITLPVGSRRWCLIVLASPTSAGSSSSQISLYFHLSALYMNTTPLSLPHPPPTTPTSLMFLPSQVDFLLNYDCYLHNTDTHTHMYVWLTARNYLCLYIHVSTHGWPLGAGQPIWSLSLKETHLFFSQRQWPPVILLQGMRSCEISCLHCMSTGDGVTLIFQEAILLRLMGAFSMSCLEDTFEQ